MIKLPFNALHTWTHVDWNRVSVRYMVDPNLLHVPNEVAGIADQLNGKSCNLRFLHQLRNKFTLPVTNRAAF